MTAAQVKRIKEKHYYDTVYRLKKIAIVRKWQEKNKERVKASKRRYNAKIAPFGYKSLRSLKMIRVTW